MDIEQSKKTLADAFEAIDCVLGDMWKYDIPTGSKQAKERLLCDSYLLHKSICYLIDDAEEVGPLFRVTIPYDSQGGDEFSYSVYNRVITFETKNRTGGVLNRSIREVKMLPTMTVDDLVCTEDLNRKIMVITLKDSN